MARKASLLVVAAASVAVFVGGAASRPSLTTSVAKIVDGDTIVVSTGASVRLLQIDAPEAGTGECHSRASARELRGLLPPGARIELRTDPRLDAVDRYGRLLRYVVRGTTNVNVALVRRGAATVWFYGGKRGRHAGQLLYAGRLARGEGRGLWGACNTAWNPYAPARASHKTSARSARARRGCDPSYPTVCIPSPPPALDCRDIPHRRFRVLPPDPHRFDGGGDGVGCERG